MGVVRAGELKESMASALAINAPLGWERIEATVVPVAGVASFDIQSVRRA